MRESEYLKSNLKYYSFKIGNNNSRINNWFLWDWKLPAIDPRMAVSMLSMSFRFIAHTRSMSVYKNAKIYEMPSKLWVEIYVRQVIEYERIFTPKKGYTQHRYKKIRIFNSHELIKMFRDSY